MPRSQFHDYIMTDVLGRFPDITSRAMFGGYGIYQHGIFFALIANDQLYFKVDDSNRAQYEQAGSQPFVYQQGKKPMTMQYWLVPEELFVQPTELGQWIQQSVQIAVQAKNKKR